MRFRFQTSKLGVRLVLSGAILLGPGLGLTAPAKKSLDRTEDFILFTGEKVPALIGSETRDLHLYVCSGHGFRAVPFQVDKRDPEGRYVCPNEKSRDPLRDGTRLDQNDELVFMVKDAGDSCPETPWPEAAVKGVELELADPLDAGRAWVYLFDQPGAKAPETPDYVSYRVENSHETIQTDLYEFGQPLGVTYADFLRLRRPDRTWSPNLLNRTVMGMRARMLNGAIPIHVPEQEIKTVILGAIDGPVRVIWDELDLVKIKSVGLEWSTEYWVTYYANGHLTPVDINVPFTLRKVFLSIGFYWAMDFAPAMRGAIFHSPANPKGIPLDGKPHPEVDTEHDNPYLVIAGPQGAMLQVLVFDDYLSQHLVRTTMVRENLPRSEAAKNQTSDLLSGFWFKNTDRLDKGTYHYQFYHYYPFPYSEAKVKELLDLVQHPLGLSAHPLSPPADERR